MYNTNFKKGDILVAPSLNGDDIVIFEEAESNHAFTSAYNIRHRSETNWHTSNFRHASDGEEEILFKQLKREGKYWNRESRAIENIPPYNSGDILVTEIGNIFIFKEFEGSTNNVFHHCLLYSSGSLYINDNMATCDISNIRGFADNRQKERLFDALEEKGKQWNAEKKRIEDIPVYKDGDFVYEDGRIMIVKSYPNMYHANAYPEHSNLVSYNTRYGVDFSSPTFRLATEEEKQRMIDALAKKGKRWNDDKKCVEDIPKRKFKAGDKVQIKDGISSNNTNGSGLYFNPKMDEFIGEKMEIKGYRDNGYVDCNPEFWCFDEDWLEPWSDEKEELKKGDLAIFWDGDPYYASVRVFERKGDTRFIDDCVISWTNAVKFKNAEQYLKIKKG